MLKKLLTCSLVFIVLFTSLFTVNSFAADDADIFDSVKASKIVGETNVFDLKAKASILVEASTGQVLLDKNIHDRLPIASVTKIMSMLLVMEAIDSGKITYEDMVTTSPHATSMGGSQAYLAPGEKFTVREMLKAVAVHSSNDVTVALAEKIAGSEDAFVVLMNEKAKELGMQDTHFLDCTGLTDEGHYSSAYDIMVMSRELINKHPGIFDFTTIIHDTFRNGTFDLDNTNELIKFYQGCNGLKTGFTSKAGYCLAATAKRDGMQLISVVLGEENKNTRFAESKKLLDYGFANYEVAQVSKKGDPVQEATVKKGVKTKVGGVLKDDVNLLLKKGTKSKVVTQPAVSTELIAPLKAGDKVGEVIYKVDDKEVGKADIVALEEVKKASFIKLFFRMVGGWFTFNKK